MTIQKRALVFMALLGLAFYAAAAETPLLLQQPTLSRTQIGFAFAGDLWTVSREGGEARQLTAGIGTESTPFFSPDATLVAFTGEYDGNTDVYLVPAEGGVPKRLTYHPGPDRVIGWTPDGRRIVFLSPRQDPAGIGIPRFYTVGVEGGYPEELPLPAGTAASFSPDGKRLAYVPTLQWQAAWKRYRGGQTSAVWLVDLSNLKVEKVPRDNSNDSNPMWVGDKVYFLSDRNGPVSLFVYDIPSKKVDQVVPNDGLDIKAASAGAGAIVYEQFGSLNLFDLGTGKTQRLNITLSGDFPEVRPRYVKVGQRIANANVSPTGVRAVFEARGEIMTVPAEKGDVRNLTRTTGVMERDPSWSPDGKWIAYFSDDSGEYALHIIDQAGKEPAKKISLAGSPSFFYRPMWSPDGKKIAYNDKRLNLWYVDIEKGVPVKIDSTHYFNPAFIWDFTWSPDSRWLTYSKQIPSHMHVVMVYSLETGKTTQVTDGLSDANFPVFDKSGKYIFFTASTDVGLTPGWLNMSSMDRPVTRSVYVLVLRKDLPSPLAPESDEEKGKEEEKAEKKDEKKPEDKKPADRIQEGDKEKPKEPEKVNIDFDNIGQRILALPPVPAKNYVTLAGGKEGMVYLLEASPLFSRMSGGEGMTLHKFDLAQRKFEKFLDNVNGFVISANGEKILYASGQNWTIAPTTGPAEPGKGLLRTAEMEVYVEPRVEWKQMYHEVWRIERDFFYDPGAHGLDIKAAEKRYSVYLDGLAGRRDLNYLFEEMLGELTCGHVFVAGGDQPEVKPVPGGLLGADYAIENGRYRFARVYNGENWNPRLRAPLTQPGVNVTEGEYLIAVNGREVKPPDEVYKFFEATMGRQVLIKVGPNPDGKDAREVTVVPVGDESGLRHLAWIEGNRRKVDKLSNGRLAYVYLPDTAQGGFTNFNRYYFAQVGKEGAVIDERFNQGGLIADYIIDYMRRPLMGYFASRDGADYITPVGSIYGPKVMIINELAGSGGDMMPWLFRAAGIGPLVGKRTWGGLVGMAGAASLMDGGFTGAPQSGFWNPNGTWDVENHGVDPDIEVENDPASVMAGHDPQLEKAVEVCLDLLAKNPTPKHKKPAYPNYHQKL
ncbi:MAG: periplasmic component of the Tol biopolymer transport system like protein [Candidatus Aminicenantes bacterium]|nr:periplasmic component of the Tol biopolymer transport system like protein [Candidatus Aminicenantes bacterium]